MCEIKTEERPILIVEVKLDPAAYLRAWRHDGWILWLKWSIWLLLLIPLTISLGALYYSIRYQELFVEIIKNSISDFNVGILYLCAFFIMLYAVMLLVVRPRRALKRAIENLGDDTPWSFIYEFFDNHFRYADYNKVRQVSQNCDYAQITRVKNEKYCINIKTKAKNRWSIFKEGITREEEEQILKILYMHCQQIRNKKLA